MTIFQFIRIFWARWFIIAVSTASAAIGAFAVAQLVPPRYESSARLLLNLSKPDPVTGQMIQGGSMSAYLDSQKEIIRGEQVGGAVVDRLGWLSDPDLVAEYQARGASDTRDFRRWLAQRVNDKTGVDVRGSIMKISFTGDTALETKIAAEELRTAYINESLKERQAYARKYSDRLSSQAELARAAAEQAEIAKATYERETGILLTEGGADSDSARLNSLSGQVGAVLVAGASAAPSSTGGMLVAAEAEFAQASQSLGPNHPKMIELSRRIEQLRALRQREIVPDSTGAAQAAVSQAYQAQRAKVLGQRDKVERLRQLQAQVELKRDEYRRAAARAAELNLEATISDNTSKPLGIVLIPRNPAFPNKQLLVGGATAMGLGIGFVLALLVELLNRRVRGVEDLDLDDEIHCIGVIAPPGGAKVSLPHRLARKLLRRSPLGMPA